MIIKELFDTMEELILENDIEYIFSLVNQNEVFDLFTNLKFEEVNKDDVFIEEQNFQKSKFKDTRLMLKRICLNL